MVNPTQARIAEILRKTQNVTPQGYLSYIKPDGTVASVYVGRNGHYSDLVRKVGMENIATDPRAALLKRLGPVARREQRESRPVRQKEQYIPTPGEKQEKRITYTDPETGQVIREYLTQEEYKKLINAGKTANEQQKRIIKTLIKQGKTVNLTSEGVVTREGNRKTVVTSEGHIANVPQSAIVRGKFIKEKPEEIYIAYVDKNGKVVTKAKSGPFDVPVTFKNVEEYRKFLKEQAKPKRYVGQLSIGDNNIFTLSKHHSKSDEQAPKKIGEKGFLKEYAFKTGELAYDFGKEVVLGTAKLGQFQLDSFTGQYKKVSQSAPTLLFDKDVQAALTVGALGAAGEIKAGAWLIKYGFRIAAGYEGFKFLKEPTAERAASTTFYLIPEIFHFHEKTKLKEIASKEGLSYEIVPTYEQTLETGRFGIIKETVPSKIKRVGARGLIEGEKAKGAIYENKGRILEVIQKEVNGEKFLIKRVSPPKGKQITSIFKVEPETGELLRFGEFSQKVKPGQGKSIAKSTVKQVTTESKSKTPERAIEFIPSYGPPDVSNLPIRPGDANKPIKSGKLINLIRSKKPAIRKILTGKEEELRRRLRVVQQQQQTTAEVSPEAITKSKTLISTDLRAKQTKPRKVQEYLIESVESENQGTGFEPFNRVLAKEKAEFYDLYHGVERYIPRETKVTRETAPSITIKEVFERKDENLPIRLSDFNKPVEDDLPIDMKKVPEIEINLKGKETRNIQPEVRKTQKTIIESKINIEIPTKAKRKVIEKKIRLRDKERLKEQERYENYLEGKYTDLKTFKEINPGKIPFKDKRGRILTPRYVRELVKKRKDVDKILNKKTFKRYVDAYKKAKAIVKEENPELVGRDRVSALTRKEKNKLNRLYDEKASEIITGKKKKKNTFKGSIKNDDLSNLSGQALQQRLNQRAIEETIPISFSEPEIEISTGRLESVVKLSPEIKTFPQTRGILSQNKATRQQDIITKAEVKPLTEKIVPQAKREVLTRSEIRPRIKEEFNLKNELKNELKSNLKNENELKSNLKNELKNELNLKNELKSNLKNELKNELNLKQELKQDLKTELNLNILPFGDTPPPPGRYPFLKSSKKIKPSSELFTVFVRRKGKFNPIGKAKSISEAFAKGRKRVSTTAAASFRIEGPETGSNIYKRFLPEKRFRKSKKEEGVFIEKRRFRISTPGEVFEISRKGQLAQKQKKSIFNIFGR